MCNQLLFEIGMYVDFVYMLAVIIQFKLKVINFQVHFCTFYL